MFVHKYWYICIFNRDAHRLVLAPWKWWCCLGSCRAHHTPGTLLRYIPRRAVLYVPGNDVRKLRKLTSLDVDCAVLDCEDGVALNKKVQGCQTDLARFNVATFCGW